MKLSLAVIAKDEKNEIERIINDYSVYFDELCFLIDDKKIYEEFVKLAPNKCKFFLYKRSKEEKAVNHIFFDRKRNELAKLLSGEYYVRIDTDDSIDSPENIRPIAEKAKAQGINIVYCWYEYARDDYGNIHAAHYRETIVRVTDDLYWNKRIHENIIPTSTSQHRYVIEDSIKIIHHPSNEKLAKSGERNFKYLVEEYEADKENCDPRTLAYLGRMLFDKDKEKAQFFLEKHIEKSGWDEDRYMSWCLLSEIMLDKKNFKDALGCCFEALAERPDYPDAYFKLHNIYMEQQDWAKAIFWARIGFQIPMPKTFMLLDPSSYTWRPMLSLALAYLQSERYEEAWELFAKVKESCPEAEFVKKNERLFLDAVQRKKFTDHFMWLHNYIKSHDNGKLVGLFESIPSNLGDHEGLMSLKQMTLPPSQWDSKSIVFFCGKTTTDWADPSVLRGLGGSEEAVVYLSRALAKMGYDVTVYCQCGRLEGTYNNVHYLNSYKFNPRDKFNILFAWRANIFQLGEISAKRKYLWLHDLPQASQFEKGKYPFDKVIVLSEYHKSLLPDHIPQDKIFVSTNGINLVDFDGTENIIRQPKRMIYASSYDRGLENILVNWPTIRKEVPDAELHIFYGWNTYKELMLMTKSARSNEFVNKMENLMNQPGVFEHGRVGHKELLKEYARSSIFAYPCTFAGEINCIALTKAIASGCLAISNDFAVMKERNPHISVPDDEFVDRLIKALKNNEKSKTNIEEYRQQNSWYTVAKSWERNLICP